MERKERRILDLWIILIFIGNGFALASVALIRNIWSLIITFGIIAFDLYWYYMRRIKKKKPRYPLATPEGKTDVYFPRTNIPRPVYEDFRKIDEQKRKFAKLNKMLRKKKRNAR